MKLEVAKKLRFSVFLHLLNGKTCISIVHIEIQKKLSSDDEFKELTKHQITIYHSSYQLLNPNHYQPTYQDIIFLSVN